MRIAVIGASGRVGSATVRHAVAAGHDVVSVVRTRATAPAGTVVAVADGRDAAALADAVRGADAVVSCIGHVTGQDDSTLLRDSASALIEAMGSTGVRRLVAISAAAAYVAGDDPVSRFIAKPLLERMLKDNNLDTRAMEDVIRGSDLDSTLLRPSRLVPGDGSPHYRHRVDQAVWWHYNTRFDTVGRAAVDALVHPEWNGHAVFVTE
ncbi:MAG: NmrA-like family protein [Microbacteriaceae bacterium]|nr:NmrA-like family protein [Microbacteriaceae bacterium]